MIPKVVSDAGYTAVGLGVLAVQQVQVRRRETRSRVIGGLRGGRHRLESAVDQVKARIEPLQARFEPLQAKLEPIKARLEAPVSTALDRLPRVPGPFGAILESGRGRLQTALRHDEGAEKPPARHAGQGKAEAGPARGSKS